MGLVTPISPQSGAKTPRSVTSLTPSIRFSACTAPAILSLTLILPCCHHHAPILSLHPLTPSLSVERSSTSSASGLNVCSKHATTVVLSLMTTNGAGAHGHALRPQRHLCSAWMPISALLG